jgi:DNA-binding transcriptional LysR family regulator
VDLLQLRYFQAVARHEHVSRAADELRIAQPSLSRAIARLEADLGVPLFDRRGRQVRLNRSGAGFLRRVDQALRELDSGRRELADTAGLDAGLVAVAAENLRILTDVLAEFVQQHPGIRFQLFQSSAPVMRQQLDSGQIDLCLASQPLTGPELRTMDISREEILLAVPPAHRLASRRHIDIAALAGEPFITTRPGHWPRALADSLFAAAGVRLTVACEGDDPSALRGLISAGLGVGLLPASARHATPHPPVAWLHIDAPDCHRTLRFVWHQSTYLSTAARLFRDYSAQRLRLDAASTRPDARSTDRMDSKGGPTGAPRP